MHRIFYVSQMVYNYFSTIQDSSKAKIKWAVGPYNRWRTFRSEIFHARYTSRGTHYNREIRPSDQRARDVDELKADMSDFIVEIKKGNGDQYPPTVCMTWCLHLVYNWKLGMGLQKN